MTLLEQEYRRNARATLTWRCLQVAENYANRRFIAPNTPRTPVQVKQGSMALESPLPGVKAFTLMLSMFPSPVTAILSVSMLNALRQAACSGIGSVRLAAL